MRPRDDRGSGSEPSTAEERELAGRVAFLARLDDAARGELLERARVHTYPAGDAVVNEGDPGDAMYVVVSGEVEVRTHGPSGTPFVLARLSAGATFGEQALLPDGAGVRSATVRAVDGPARVLEVGRAEFLRLLNLDRAAHDELADARAQHLHNRLVGSLATLGSVNLASLEGRGVSEISCRPGEVVFREGDEGDAAYFVLEGAAVVTRSAGDSQERVARVAAGQCFGERAVVTGGRRAATVCADGAMRALRVEGHLFRRWYEDNPELKDLVQTLTSVYLDQSDALLTVHKGMWQDRECITSVQHRADGTRVVATKVSGSHAFTMTRSGGDDSSDASVVYAREADGVRREIVLRDGAVVGIISEGEWPRLGVACDRVLRGTRLEPWELVLFRKLGDFEFETREVAGSRREIVCACLRVKRQGILDAMAAGHDSVEAVSAVTGAGNMCGACTPALFELIGSADFLAVRAENGGAVARNVHRFVLHPAGEALPPALPGQSVVVRGLLEQGWVQRTYMLSDVNGPDGWEITVKREPEGLFSRWLCDQRESGTMLRVGKPSGKFLLPKDANANVVFFAAGIGVAPALAMLRAQAAKEQVRSLHVHYSAQRSEDFIQAAELVRLAGSCSSISVTLRPTRVEGLLTAAEVRALAAERPGAWFLLCGPLSYMEDVGRALMSEGVPSGRIRRELFTPTDSRLGDGARVGEGVTGGDLAPFAAGAPAEPGPEADFDGALQPSRLFLEEVYRERGAPETFAERWRSLVDSRRRGTPYRATTEEVAHAVRSAWRQQGLPHAERLVVLDRRSLGDASSVFGAVVEHVMLTGGSGRSRPLATALGNGVRVSNPALVAYAGFRRADGTVLGDQSNVGSTERLMRLGWRPEEGRDRRFVALPLEIQTGDDPSERFSFPRGCLVEVPIAHPDREGLSSLGLRWFTCNPGVLAYDFGDAARGQALSSATPVVEDIVLALVHPRRMGLAREIAEALGVPVPAGRPEPDREPAWVLEVRSELARAVRDSFSRAGVELRDDAPAEPKSGDLGAAPASRAADVAATPSEPPRPAIAPPIAQPGPQALPLIGPVIAGIATLRGPLEQAAHCRVESGNVFTIPLPGNPITYLLGAKGYAFFNDLPVETAGIGGVLQLVSVFGRWISRADRSAEYLELLALAGRSYIQERLLGPERIAAMPPLVEEMAARQTESWGGRMDLASCVIALVHSVSFRCIAGEKAWQELHAEGLPLLRTMASGIDVPRLTVGGTPLRFLMNDYWAARALEKLLRRRIAEHSPAGPGFDLIDDLRAGMVVGGKPLDERDLPWAMNYVLFNACAYPGSYGFWSLVDMVSDRATLDAVRGGGAEEGRQHAERAFLETIRLNPVTVAARALKAGVRYVDDTPSGRVAYDVPGDHALGSAPASFTRDPAVYEDPARYCPHRFERGEPVPELFGGGAFGCVAEGYVRSVLPTILTFLLRRFDFEIEPPLPRRRARPALHYPHAPLFARVTRRVAS